MNIPFLRFERKEVPLPDYDKLHHVSNEVEAAALAGKLASSLHKRVYLTTGSKTMGIFAKAEALQDIDVWTAYCRRRKCWESWKTWRVAKTNYCHAGTVQL